MESYSFNMQLLINIEKGRYISINMNICINHGICVLNKDFFYNFINMIFDSSKSCHNDQKMISFISFQVLVFTKWKDVIKVIKKVYVNFLRKNKNL